MKPRKVSFIMAIISCLLFACNNDKVTTKAYVEQRTKLNDSILKLNYRYLVQEKLYRDSIEIKNKIIVADSLVVSFSKNNPQTNAVQMP